MNVFLRATIHILTYAGLFLGGGGVSESMDGRGCAILALELVPKNLILAEKSYPKIYFTRFYACNFSLTNISASSLWQVVKINYEILW